ncbi:hypothetical protein QTP88_025852 [Uroleucon formosanum]
MSTYCIIKTVKANQLAITAYGISTINKIDIILFFKSNAMNRGIFRTPFEEFQCVSKKNVCIPTSKAVPEVAHLLAEERHRIKECKREVTTLLAVIKRQLGRSGSWILEHYIIKGTILCWTQNSEYSQCDEMAFIHIQ